MLRLVSSRSENAAFLFRAVAAWLERELAMPVDLDESGDWREREAALLEGRAHVGFVCSIPYVRHPDRLDALAAPVMAGVRYGGRPIYFSDVLVRRGSPCTSFEDLRGCRWAYNEPDSHSGCNVTRHYLASTGRGHGFFGSIVETGAHECSLEALLDGRVDATALDSVVWELELAARPRLASQVRVVETFGRSPGPPVVASGVLPEDLRRRIAGALCRFPGSHPAALRYGLAGFSPVTDGFYDPIRRMAEAAETVPFSPSAALRPSSRTGP